MLHNAALPEPLAVSIDLEEYFQVEAMAGVVRREDWTSLAPRIDYTTHRLLELFAAAGAHATFFVVGWLAERYPRLIAEVAAAGHELGCHSYWHRPVFRLSAAEFREDTRRAKAAIEAAAGVPIYGYRAPNFSIRCVGAARMPWALEVLAEAGFHYDSSLHPVRHPLYGAADAPRHPFLLPEFGLWEFPLATVACGRQRLPMAGGAYWRVAPAAYIHWALRAAQRQGLRPVCYLHPWEIDPAQPRLALPLRSRLRHYTGLASTASKLRGVLQAFPCRTIAALYPRELARSGAVGVAL